MSSSVLCLSELKTWFLIHLLNAYNGRLTRGRECDKMENDTSNARFLE
jgi:hypothetical protein